jgi:GT2 family glycosyltransferase/tetratricopeptide (TPR) repeat protein
MDPQAANARWQALLRHQGWEPHFLDDIEPTGALVDELLDACCRECIALREASRADLSLALIEIIELDGYTSPWLKDNRARALLAQGFLGQSVYLWEEIERIEPVGSEARKVASNMSVEVSAEILHRLQVHCDLDGWVIQSLHPAGEGTLLEKILREAISLRKSQRLNHSLGLLEAAEALGVHSGWIVDNKARAWLELGQPAKAARTWGELRQQKDDYALQKAAESNESLACYQLLKELDRFSSKQGWKAKYLADKIFTAQEAELACLKEIISAREADLLDLSISMAEHCQLMGMESGWLLDNKARGLILLERRQEALQIWQQLSSDSDEALSAMAREMLELNRQHPQLNYSGSGSRLINCIEQILQFSDGRLLVKGKSSDTLTATDLLVLDADITLTPTFWKFLARPHFVAEFPGTVSTPQIWMNGVRNQSVPIDLSQFPWPQRAEILLEQLDLENHPTHQANQLLENHLGPVIRSLHPSPEELLVEISHRENFGAKSRQSAMDHSIPRISIIIPLFGRLDLLEAQLVALATDPELCSAEVELIYVVDDPDLLEPVLHWCRRTGGHLGLSFTVLGLDRNHGFAAACNTGAAHAKGETLVVMNSDVFPKNPGWLFHLVEHLNNNPWAGILGPILLYPDGSVQHAGMSSVPAAAFGGLRLNRHPGKGLSAQAYQEPVQEVELLSGALLCLPRALYQRLGGFRQTFIRGDFEDSDLCQRIKEEGFLCALATDVQLWHGERQSFAGREVKGAGLQIWRVLANAWLAQDGRR